MAVLKQSTEWVEEVEQDEEGEETVRRFTRPRLDIVVGPVSRNALLDGGTLSALVLLHRHSLLLTLLADAVLRDLSPYSWSFGSYFS